MKQNITRAVMTCKTCLSKYQDLDGSGYCENCEPPETIPYAWIPPETIEEMKQEND